jgi:leucyl/phenylalanyl-tRNA--protein transferase
MLLDADGHRVDAQTVLLAYRSRCFPMAEHRQGRLAWFRPDPRAVITWDAFKLPRSLKKVARKEPYRITVDRAFEPVMEACADRFSTWISHDIQALYCQLHELGHAHSVEAWDGQGKLVGGCYGLVIDGVFCGESMFHRATDASKLCVYHLILGLQAGGFFALDCQQQSEHMARFGAREISDAAYADLLDEAADAQTDWETVVSRCVVPTRR